MPPSPPPYPRLDCSPLEQAAGLALGGFVRAALYAHQSAVVNAYLTDLVDATVLIVAADLHVIRFSAGTTGRPKGIAHTVEGWLRSNDEYRWVSPQLDERDLYLALGQLTHAASVFLWPILAVGGRIVVVPAFEPGSALELIERERASITLVVPTMIHAQSEAWPIGEIAVRGAARMLEIWKDPAATAARTLPDGSLCTRDMGRLDAAGYLFLADRKDDMIISGGFNIWPAELENAIAAHPAVAEVAVVGVPHEKWGETPIAVAVPNPGAAVDEAELIAFCRAKVGAVNKITAVEVVDELPKSGVGKVLRRLVRDRYWAGRERHLGGA